MEEASLNLRPSRRLLTPKEQSSRLDAALSSLDNTLPANESAISADPVAEGAAILRQRLAVRGWVSPHDILKEFGEDLHDGILRAVAPDVELATQARPGQWYMSIAARRQIFANVDAPVLQSQTRVLSEADESDPVRLAMCVALGLDPTPIGDLKREVVQELARLGAWRDPRSATVASGRAEWLTRLDGLAASAAAHVQRLRRDTELERASAFPLIGRDPERDRILKFLRGPRASTGVQTLYVRGIGGSGKSTLLLAAETKIRQEPSARVIRLDFDSPYIDVMNPERMDVLLLRQLRAEAPDHAADLQWRMELLQSLSEKRVQARIEAAGDVETSASTKSVKRGVKQTRKASHAPDTARAVEGASVSEHYERISALSGIGELSFMTGRSLILFLDTVENVSRLGAAAVDSVLDWIGSLIICAFQGDLRVVLAGRDALGSEDMSLLAGRFEAHDLRLAPGNEVVLGDLDVSAAIELLTLRSMPPEAAKLASEALPRNPLVLWLAADMYVRNPDDVVDIQAAYKDGRIDRLTAGGYLAQRVVAHVPSQPARQYAVASMILPLITEQQLRDIVIPAVDEDSGADRTRLARRVYGGLRRISWLTVEDEPGKLRWQTELRNLVLPMIAADKEHAAIYERVRAAAIVWHERQRSPELRAYATYHRLIAGSQTLDPAAERIAQTFFSRFVGDLPQGTSGLPGARQTAVAPGHDSTLHQMRLEGLGGRAGEGDRLTAQGRGSRALDLYRERPTRKPGVPPNFVIRALGDTAQWERNEVDTDAVLREISDDIAKRKRGMNRPTLERLYGLTRLELLKSGYLKPFHVSVLGQACSRLSFTAQNGALFGLVATTEALHSIATRPTRTDTRPTLGLIAPAVWPPANARIGSEIRFSMVRTVYGAIRGETRPVATTLDCLLVMDRRWEEAITQLSRAEILVLPGGADTTSRLGEQMISLASATLAEIEQFVAICREIPIRIDLARTPPERAAWLLRGTTIEFHRPLASAITAAILSKHPRTTPLEQRRVALEALVRFVRTLRTRPPEAMLCLAEFSSHARLQAQARSFESAVASLIVLLDRAHALGAFCREFPKLFPHTGAFAGADPAALRLLFQLCERFLQWDCALNPMAVHEEVPIRRSPDNPATPASSNQPQSDSAQTETISRQLARLRQHISTLLATDPALVQETADLKPPSGPRLEAQQPETAEQQIALESIVLRRMRPVFTIRDNETKLDFTDKADSDIWLAGLTKAKPFLDSAIRAVGRINLQGGRLDWAGTGWLVAHNILVTTRHVAREFVTRRADGYAFQVGPNGPVSAAVDFLQEVDNPETRSFRLIRPLHVEEEPGPDLSFFEVESSSDSRLAVTIQLARNVTARQNVAVIGYPSFDSRTLELDLMESIYGNIYNKKRLAPGAVTRVDELLIAHNCTTLGGCAGSVVIDLETGEALGLHVSGSFLSENYAVRSDVVQQILATV